jgi:foldase protein PrsA
MKKVIGFLMMFLLIILACSQGGDSTKLAKGTPAYDFAVQITEKLPYFNPEDNNPVITTKDFNVTTGEVVKTLMDNMGSRASQLVSLDSTRMKSILMQNATNIAEKKLLLKAANSQNISVPATEIDSVLNTQYLRFGGKDKYTENLKNNGIELDYVKTQITEGMTIEKYLDTHLKDETAVTEDDIEKAYNQDKTATVRHILLMTQGKSDSEKVEIRKKMEMILDKARKGADFAKLANEYSEDPGSNKKGGLYEDFGKGQMVKPFEDAAFSVPIGGISNIIETQYGYHILKVIDRKKETKPLNEVHDQLKKQLEQQKKNEAYVKLMDSLKSEVNFAEVEF